MMNTDELIKRNRELEKMTEEMLGQQDQMWSELDRYRTALLLLREYPDQQVAGIAKTALAGYRPN